jgi:hypothetical protein
MSISLSDAYAIECAIERRLEKGRINKGRVNIVVAPTLEHFQSFVLPFNDDDKGEVVDEFCSLVESTFSAGGNIYWRLTPKITASEGLLIPCAGFDQRIFARLLITEKEEPSVAECIKRELEGKFSVESCEPTAFAPNGQEFVTFHLCYAYNHVLYLADAQAVDITRDGVEAFLELPRPDTIAQFFCDNVVRFFPESASTLYWRAEPELLDGRIEDGRFKGMNNLWARLVIA